MENNGSVYFARNIADAIYQLKTTSNLQVCGACTQLEQMPKVALVVRNIEELKTIDRKERYVEFGSAVTLSQILELGEKRMPGVLHDAISLTAIPLVRNVATIGGNICASGIKRTLFAPLLALDARLELRSNLETLTVPMSQFNGVPSGYMLTRIRVPLEEWDVAVFRRIGPAYRIDNSSASFVFLANTQKDRLLELRIAFCGAIRFRSRDLENILIGTKLPLVQRDIENMKETASKVFDEVTLNSDSVEDSGSELFKMLKIKFLNLLKYSLEQLT